MTAIAGSWIELVADISEMCPVYVRSASNARQHRSQTDVAAPNWCERTNVRASKHSTLVDRLVVHTVLTKPLSSFGWHGGNAAGKPNWRYEAPMIKPCYPHLLSWNNPRQVVSCTLMYPCRQEVWWLDAGLQKQETKQAHRWYTNSISAIQWLCQCGWVL